jgi:hypothetical protein
MTPLSALDISGIRFRRHNAWSYIHDCPWCGGAAWSGREHTQCLNASCVGQVAAPLDIVAKVFGVSHVEADAYAMPLLGRKPDPAAARERATQRMILDFWVRTCLDVRTNSESRLASKLSAQGLGVNLCAGSAAVFGAERMKMLREVAIATGAEYPDSWDTNLPTSGLVYCVQSAPHTIDRLVLLKNTASQEVVWYRKKAGISGLIGTSPFERRHLASGKTQALILQRKLEAGGGTKEVASVFSDTSSQATSCSWSPDGPIFTAVISCPDEVVTLQRALTCFHDAEAHVNAAPESALTGLAELSQIPSWNAMRRSVIETLTPPRATRVSPKSALIFEQTGSRADDAASLLSKFLRDGRLKLAEDFKRLTENRTISDERGVLVRETANEYQVVTSRGCSIVANFAVRPDSVVIFRDRGGEIYYRCKLFYGRKISEAVISQMALEAPKNLKDELLGCIIADSSASNAPVVPTVIDSNTMKTKVLPYLRAQVAYLPSIEGVSRLGWSQDRTSFHAPGMVVDLNGKHIIPAVFHPALPTLRSFQPVHDWSETYPAKVHKSCQAVIAVMLALTVRFFKRCVLRPACIMQTSEAARVVEYLARCVGQRTPYELGHNTRERSDAEGIRGYPFVATGYGRGQLLQASVPYVIMTDSGMAIDEGPDQSELEEGGRALQFALMRVVEWCLATGADEFKEQASTDFNMLLLREGQWLAEHVCKLEPWEVASREDDPMSSLLAQIPPQETAARITVVNGTLLRLDATDLLVDMQALAQALRDQGAAVEVDELKLTATASIVMPAIYAFYGGEPELSVEDDMIGPQKSLVK